MLGDTAVAVNPSDERYQALIGKKVRLPLVGRELPIIADLRVDKEFGTGALKITPAHDPVDFEIGLTHNLPRVIAIDKDGKMTQEAGKYQGLDRFTCRETVIKDLKEQGYLIKSEKYVHNVGHCYRCQTVVEPYLSFQWFVKMKTLAEPAIEAVRDGKIRIIPSVWEKTYYEWMLNIRDWCISRQLWWGHQIPAWFCQDCGTVNVAVETPKQCQRCGSTHLIRETDVLDTWFSSGLWPFSTLGWPDKTKELEIFYPTSTLLTGFDILFFWVARMIMMGLKFCQDVPFRDVYIHALIRDAEGRKMSKSKGNVVDPLLIMDKYGTDAFRFTLTAFAAQGRDIRFSEERTEGYRNFANKIWNASRFVLMNLRDAPTNEANLEYSLADQWILSRLQSIIQEINQTLTDYKFNEAAHAIYQFIWHEFCDWYIELAKPSLYSPISPAQKVTAQYVLSKVLETSLRLLHPIMPFITEEIWQKLPHEGESIVVAHFPSVEAHYQDPEAEKKMNLLMGVITKVRNIRSEVNLAPAAKIELVLKTQDLEVEALLNQYRSYLSGLTKAETIQIGKDLARPEFSATDVYEAVEIFLPLKGLINLTDELNRLNKEIDKIDKEIRKIETKLANQDFLHKAPSDVVETEKVRLEEALTTRKKLEGHLWRLKELSS
jgi:valyl-tRNA synthetase